MKYEYVPNSKFNPSLLKFKGQFIGKGKPIIYKSVDFCSLDTETSYIDETGWIYQWCFSYPVDEENRQLIYGRTPVELIECLEKIIKINNLNDNRQLTIFVHNLSYDYNFFKDWLEEKLGYKGTTVNLKSHDLISYNISGLNFRCSYKLSNRSLNKWGDDLNVKHKKLVGAIDYNKVIFQDDKLYKNDWKYMFRDVICLDECIIAENELHNNTILTMPLTSTGYIRNYTREKFKEDKKNINDFNRTKLSFENYLMVNHEISGGLVHGNRFYAERTIKGTIKHRDFVSHYPSQEVTGKCPVGKFVDDYKKKIEDILKDKDNCYFVGMIIKDVELKDIFISMPYLQESKLLADNNCETVVDNGRILSIKGQCIIVVNEYDLEIIHNQYEFEYNIIKCIKARKGKFPQYLIDTAKHFMLQKTICKERVKKSVYGTDEYYKAKMELDLNKKMLNSISGMTLTKPIRDIFYENENGEWDFLEKTKEQKEEELNKFYEKKSSFVGVEIGAYTTAQGRYLLIKMAEIIGYNNVLYGDTDSLFYISTPEIEAKIEAWNKEQREIADENGYYIEYNGKKVYFNQFELEDEDITEFRFLHSKCYAYKTSDGQLHTVIAGVNGKGRDKELGDIENLRDGFVFKKCGGTTIKYINNSPEIKEINGHFTEIASCAIIKANEKTLKSIFSEKEELEVYYTL